MEMEVIATHHVGTRIEKTTLLYLSPAHITVIFTPPYHVAITILSQAVNVTPHIPLISSFIATVAPPLFFQNLVLLPLPKLLALLKPPPQIRNPLLSIELDFSANLQHVLLCACRLPRQTPRSQTASSFPWMSWLHYLPLHIPRHQHRYRRHQQHLGHSLHLLK
jgi:hypothetical protein